MINKESQDIDITNSAYSIGSLVTARGREWVVLPNSTDELIIVKPLGGRDDEIICILTDLEPIKSASLVLSTRWQEIIGVKINDWAIKQMKTMWGNCNIIAKRIWFNLELAKKPEDCLEYIIVHELVYLLEKHHSENCKALMDKYLSDWRVRKDILNRFPLIYEEWGY